MRLRHSLVNGAQFDASLIEGDAGSETSEKLRHAMDAASNHGCRQVVRAGDNVGHDFGILGIRHGGFEDADDGGSPSAHGPAAKSNGFAEHRRIFLKSRRPEMVGENDHAVSLGTVVLGSNETAEHRVEAHDVEIGAADDASLNFARLTEANHSEPEDGEIAKRAQAFNAGAQILDFGHGECCVLVAYARCALPDINQPVFVAVDERLEQHAAHQREDCGVGADPQRQRQHHRDCKPFGASERPERNSQVVNEGHNLAPSRKSVSQAIEATPGFASVLPHLSLVN